MSCAKASKFMDARKIRAQEVVPASRKLAREEARGLAKQAARIIVAKGGKVAEFAGGRVSEEVVEAMLGPTGNLRAPAIRAGKTLLVGFDEQAYRDALE
jgi:arsenate reductase-like glutaredoxin family protein